MQNNHWMNKIVIQIKNNGSAKTTQVIQVSNEWYNFAAWKKSSTRTCHEHGKVHNHWQNGKSRKRNQENIFNLTKDNHSEYMGFENNQEHDFRMENPKFCQPSVATHCSHTS